MKTCSRCKKAKEPSEFSKNSRTKSGLHSYCQQCSREKSREWARKNPERHKDNAKKWQQDNPDRVAQHAFKRRIKRYGIEVNQYLLLLNQQGGRCKVCGRPGLGTSLVVDHDHKCCSDPGKSCGACVRGLLCTQCNIMLGMAGDNVEILKSAIKYLGG